MTDPNPRTPAINPEHVQSKTIGTLLAPILAALGLDPTSPDYAVLIDAMLAALEQATCGKGKERHARGRDFTDQPILVIPRLLGDAGVGFLVGQAMKKAEEALLLQHERKLAELRGAVNYLLAATIHIVERATIEESPRGTSSDWTCVCGHAVSLHTSEPKRSCLAPKCSCGEFCRRILAPNPVDPTKKHDHIAGYECPVLGCSWGSHFTPSQG